MPIILTEYELIVTMLTLWVWLYMYTVCSWYTCNDRAYDCISLCFYTLLGLAQLSTQEY